MDEQNSFQYIISQQKVPCVCKTSTIFQAVKLSTFDPKNLSKILSREVLKFRVGERNAGEVQWEGLCSVREASINDIIIWNEIKDCKRTNNMERKIQQTLGACCNKHYWCYADYMYMKDLFKNHPEMLPLLNWNSLGFHNKDGGDSTMWLGTVGAHTLCHYDTYGYNIVVQISGRKKWVLFPPSDSDCLYPTRIPYEESSVFSQVNIKQPDVKKHPKFSSAHAYVTVLNPGDMLYVPHHWWHYVENLDLSVSINLWYEMESDAESRLHESITRLLVGSCSHVATTSDFSWINPNESASSVKSVDDNLRYLRQSLDEVSRFGITTENNNHEDAARSTSNLVQSEISVQFPNRDSAIRIMPLMPTNAMRIKSYHISKTPVKKMKTLSMINARKNKSLDDLTYTEFVKCLTHSSVVGALSKVLQKQFSDSSESDSNSVSEVLPLPSLPIIDMNCSEVADNSNNEHVLVEVHETEEEIETSPLVDDNNENIEYTIVEGGSQRCSDKLYDSLGFSYSSARKTPKHIYWRCIIRTGSPSCSAAVLQYKNNRFVRNSHQHNHEPKPGVTAYSQFMKEAKEFALNNPTVPTREIATLKLEEASVLYPASWLPSTETLMSYMARYRRRNSIPHPRPKRKKSATSKSYQADSSS